MVERGKSDLKTKIMTIIFHIYSVVYRVFLRIFRPHHWHMRNIRPTLKIVNNKDDSRSVYYKGRKIFQTIATEKLSKINGDSLFIIGSGPSIKSTNMDLLKEGKNIFCVNGSIAVKDIYGLQVSYYIALDDSFLENRLNDVIDAIQSDIICFISLAGIKLIAEYDISILENKKNIYIIENYYEQYGFSFNEKLNRVGKKVPVAKESLSSKRPIIFSQNLEDGIFIGGTVIYSALQIAAAIGYEKIYILGMDLGFSKGQERFYKENSPENTRYHEELKDIIIPQMKLAKNVLANQVQIYNLSLESKLPSTVFEKKKLEDVIN